MRLTNTLTNREEEFTPLRDDLVTMYVCGPTVQGPPHFGHARAAIVPDVLRRYLEWSGHRVFHVRNITDVDDKIIARAQEEGRDFFEVGEHFARVWDQQITRLNVLWPHVVPRATGHIPEMIALITRLIANGAAYPSGGDVYFRVRAFPEYGKLSNRNVDELRAGARIEPGEHKEDPADFALWKAAKPGEPSWDSPWGPGRPGWHIECSAMSSKYLGETFDIHAGGVDLVFPHHENEVAQSEAATGRQFARYWVHNGLLTLGAEKMSKSVGNIISLDEAIATYGGDVLRFFYLAAHYRSPVEFSEERLSEAQAAIERWRTFLRLVPEGDGAAVDTPGGDEPGTYRDRFRAALDDDLSTPQAHAVLFDLATAGLAHAEAGRSQEASALRALFVELARDVMGYRLEDRAAGDLVGPLVEELLALRQEARARKDFATSDRVRDRLAGLGVVIEDTPGGSRWHLA
ncbi:MAG TPA: cysteine--tRNA ligase [Egibacteraceae bacterium]|nr:cysteine--tRNA ligase [Egibacteraceae bacterium]